jgi:hypothetical protein
MALEIKFFKLNDIDLGQFTHRIRDSQKLDTGTIPNLGEEQRQFAESELGTRLITWEGYVSNESSYITLRKTLFDSSEKILQLHPERKITLSSVEFDKLLDIKKPEDSKMTLTMVAADTREYNITSETARKAITISPEIIAITSSGSAPTTPQWTITAAGTIINPTISDGVNRMEWFGTLNPGDVMVISKEGAVTINGASCENVSGSLPRAAPGATTFTFQDDADSSHNCTVEAVWNDAYY